MTMFYFDASVQGRTLPDDEGSHFSSFDEALSEARLAAAELTLNQARNCSGRDVVEILVRDELGRHIGSIVLQEHLHAPFTQGQQRLQRRSD